MASVSGWTEVILLSLAFVAILGLVIGNFNFLYGGNNSLGLSDNSTEQLFVNYQDTSQQQIKGGDVQLNAVQGITLKSSYGLVVDSMNIAWTFISGGWIEKLASYWNAGESGMALARTLRIIYFISLVFSLLYALFRVMP